MEGRIDMGLQLLKFWMSPDLKMGVIFAIFSLQGTIPVVNDLLKIWEMMGAISLTLKWSRGVPMDPKISFQSDWPEPFPDFV